MPPPSSCSSPAPSKRGPPRPPAAAPDPAIACADYELGSRYWDVGQYDKALDAFRSAYAHRSDPALMFNVARCLRKLKRTSEALDMYRFSPSNGDIAPGIKRCYPTNIYVPGLQINGAGTAGSCPPRTTTTGAIPPTGPRTICCQ